MKTITTLTFLGLLFGINQGISITKQLADDSDKDSEGLEIAERLDVITSEINQLKDALQKRKEAEEKREKASITDKSVLKNNGISDEDLKQLQDLEQGKQKRFHSKDENHENKNEHEDESKDVNGKLEDVEKRVTGKLLLDLQTVAAENSDTEERLTEKIDPSPMDEENKDIQNKENLEVIDAMVDDAQIKKQETELEKRSKNRLKKEKLIQDLQDVSDRAQDMIAKLNDELDL